MSVVCLCLLESQSPHLRVLGRLPCMHVHVACSISTTTHWYLDCSLMVCIVRVCFLTLAPSASFVTARPRKIWNAVFFRAVAIETCGTRIFNSLDKRAWRGRGTNCNRGQTSICSKCMQEIFVVPVRQALRTIGILPQMLRKSKSNSKLRLGARKTD